MFSIDYVVLKSRKRFGMSKTDGDFYQFTKHYAKIAAKEVYRYEKE